MALRLVLLAYFFKADYWKSNARKHCDFCKCWIADNKPSVEFHEKGRRHQDNVAKRLKFLTKKSRRDEHENIKIDQAMAKMESAALEAYRKDVENNADLTSKAINKKLDDENLAIRGETSTATVVVRKIWKEVKSDDGSSYYWNTDTNESAWETPSDGFISVEEQKNESSDKSQKQWKEIMKKQTIGDRIQKEREWKEKEEIRAAAAREKLKERRVEEIKPVESGPILPPGKTEPYGQWKTVTVPKNLDWQLPQQKEEEHLAVPELVYEPPPKEFKEKTVESLGGGNTSFKKRKFGPAKRSVRQRIEDD